MVGLTAVLARVPVIRFRKGGLGLTAAAHSPAPSAAATAPAASTPTAQAPKAAMSTSTITDMELPLRYQRRPISKEEIDHINGGGIV